MGIALIVPGISFSGANLGKVTLQGNIPISGIDISGPSSATGAGDAATYEPEFIPVNTTQREVTWSIISGSSYASINSSTGVLSILSGASSSEVTIGVTSSSDPSISAEKTITVSYSDADIPEHTGAAYFFPLISSSSPSEGSISVSKENTNYSSNGALFDEVGEGIVYTLPEGEVGYAIAMDFKKLSNLGTSNGNYWMQIGKYNDVQSTNNDGISLFTSANSNNPGSSNPSDFTFASNAFTLNEWHRLCVAIIDASEYLYIDGQLIGSHSGFQINNSSGYIILGNNWRYRKSDGDRVFGGYIRNVAVWTSAITEEDMVDFSKMAEE